MRVFFIIFIFFSSNLFVFSQEDFIKVEEKVSKTKKDFIEDSFNIHYFIWAGRILYVRNKDSKIFDTSPKKWTKNITNPEWNDGDSFHTNYVYHPYFGALYYQIYKDLGYENNQAYIGSIIQSTLWEFAIEGTVEKPSILDIVVTPTFGIPLGIYFEKLNKKLENSPHILNRALSYIINPAKVFLSKGDVGFFNPVAGSFMVYKPFKYSDSVQEEKNLNYSFLSDSPLPSSIFRLRSYFFDVKQWRGGGSDIFYFLDTEFASTTSDFSFFLSFPWAGPYDGNDINYEVVDNGFEVGNWRLGIKNFFDTNYIIDLSANLSLSLPTSTFWDDSKNRLEKLHSNSIFLKDVLHDSTIITPQVFIISKYVNIGFSSEFFFNADDYSGEREETFFVYDLDINLLNFKNNRYSLIYEFKAIDQLTEEGKNLDTISALTFRSKNKINFGLSVIMPISGEINKYINNSIAADLTLEFN